MTSVAEPDESDLWDDSFESIRFFRGDYDFLSNFHPCELTVSDLPWPTAEHLFQACKTFDFTHQEHVRLAPTPGEAKKRGRAVAIRWDWEQVKDQTMKGIVTIKFPRDPANTMTMQLLTTGRRKLIEGNWWHDQYWGDCYCDRPGRPNCRTPGRNRLGVLLMRRRAELLG